MSDTAKIMLYNMALQGLMPGISDMIVRSKEFQGFGLYSGRSTERGFKAMEKLFLVFVKV